MKSSLPIRMILSWMDYDSVILDTETLTDLNATLVDLLKDFVQKKGGGLLLFGPAEKGRELLGGLVPAKEVERILVKDNLSLAKFWRNRFSGPRTTLMR